MLQSARSPHIYSPSLPADPQITGSINHVQSIANLWETYFTQALFEMIILVSFWKLTFF